MTTERPSDLDERATVQQVLDGYPAPTLIVDGDVRVLMSNGPARAMIEGPARHEPLPEFRLGELLRCVGSFGPGGCGLQEQCTGCVIRGAVRQALAEGGVHRAKSFLRHSAETGVVSEVCLLVSAWQVDLLEGKRVLLTLENVSDFRLKAEFGRVEKALRENEERLRLFVEYTPLAVAMLDRQMRYLAASRRFAADRGTKTSELVGRTHSQVFPEDSDRWKEIYERGLAGAAERCDEESFRRRDGTTDWMRWEVHPWRDVSGQIGGIIVFSEVVTQRKQSEERLAAERQRLSVTLQSIGDAVIACDQEGRITLLNGVAEVLTGWKSEEAIGRPLREVFAIIDEDTRQLVESPVDRALREGVIVGLTKHTALVARDGTERPIADSGAPIRDSAGKISGVVLVFRDQTEERRAEEVLRESERQYRLLFVANPNPMYVFDEATLRFLAVNEATVRSYGWTREEFLARTVLDIRPPEERARAQKLIESHRGAKDRVVGVFRHWRKDGTLLDMEVATSSISLAGRPARLCSVTDVTDRKKAEQALRESEARFRLALRNAPVSVAAQDRELRYTWAYNQRTARSDEIIGKLDAEIFTAEAAERLTAIKRRVLAEGVEHREQMWLDRPSGRVFLDVCWEPIRDEAGEVVGVASATVDLTPVKLAQDALRDREALLREADRRKTEFLATLSHELRNPLTPIRNNLHLLRHAAPGSPQDVNAREVIARQTEQLAHLVDDLLDVTRIEKGKIHLELSRIDLRELLSRTCDDHRTLFDARSIQLRLEAPPGPIWVEGDTTRITQIIGNLLQNAAKFCHEGGLVEASIATAHGQAELRVRDNGTGIAPELLPRIFEPFVQADGGLARPRGGLGLGLALVKRLVDLHGGTVLARSEGSGLGSEVLVTLPLASTPAPVEAASPAVQARTLDVLVIEDNVDAAESLADVLALEGHRVHVATNGRSGIALARQLRPQVILCDIGLPDLNGYEVARTLRVDGLTSARLIAVSGYGQPEDRKKAAEAGFDDHIAKPPSIDALLASVRMGASGKAGGRP